MYTTNPTAIAIIVPRGMDFLGLRKSPDMATPAVKPVTAGKKTANNASKGKLFSADKVKAASGLYAGLKINPSTIDTIERKIAANMKNCVLMAAEVLIKAMITSKKTTAEPIMRD